MYQIYFEGEAIVHAEDEEQAREDFLDDMALPMTTIEITKIKELD